jgi:penicillin-binding protein 2
MLTPGAHEERRSLESRLLALRVGLAVCVGLLAVAFWVLQVVQYADHLRIAENNHLRTIPLRAPRGVLFDRDGRVLVKSEPSFTIALVREQSADLDAAMRMLASVLGIDEAPLRARLEKHRRDPVFRPIPVVEHATFAQVAAVTARKLELPEVVVQRVPTRSYPSNALGAHLFGYVSEIRESQLDRPEFASLQAGAIVGQTGLERAYNARLMGEDGNRFVVVDSIGREIEELNEQVPVDGQALQLTIDYDLQRALEDAFRESGFAGAAAFLVPDTGEVLAMTSLPA